MNKGIDILSNEIKLDIFEYLRPIELLKYKGLNHEYYNICMYLFNLKIKKSRLFKNIDCVDELFSFFNKKCVLSGSCLLQFLLNEDYYEYSKTIDYNTMNIIYESHNTDIDIFLTQANYELLDEFLIDNDYIKISKGNSYSNLSNLGINDFKVYDYVKNKQTIQLICVYNTYKSVYSFDLKIVKNMYDGKNCFTNVETLLTKNESIYYKTFFKNSRLRIKKYIKRGFTFNIINKNKKCNYCGSCCNVKKLCSVCKLKYYCNNHCFNTDWKKHNCKPREYQDDSKDKSIKMKMNEINNILMSI
jgi:hypothetical protein